MRGKSDSSTRSGRWQSAIRCVLAMSLVWSCCCAAGWTAEPGASVAVLYNSNLAASRELAEYYAARRHVPAAQLFGFELPDTEVITRGEFQSRLQKPLMRRLDGRPGFEFALRRRFFSGSKRTGNAEVPKGPSIRYLVLCYGMPLKISEEPGLNPRESLNFPMELRRNEAAVDSELAVLPGYGESVSVIGPAANPAYGATNLARLHPTNGVLMVSRLDGPSIEVARGLVDRALEAEKEGLWGRAYFDARGLTNGNSKLGDDWIKGAEVVSRKLGFETVLDDRDERFGRGFPMSQVALYAGWYEYDGQISGPFLESGVEFVPGAFAYHLHSFSAATVRSKSRNWVGPLLSQGATATMGAVFEPYLEFTPNIAMFFHRWIYLGFSFGEAAYASQGYLSWQNTVIGDPLYRPFALRPKEQHQILLDQGSAQLEWSVLKIVNINREAGLPTAELIEFLEQTELTARSSVLSERMGDLNFAEQRFDAAVTAYCRGLELATSPLEKIRLSLSLGRALTSVGDFSGALYAYEQMIEDAPDYPDRAGVYRMLLDLARKLERPEVLERYQNDLQRLSGNPVKGS